MIARRLTSVAVAIAMGAAIACTFAPADSRIGVTEPSRPDFPAVNELLVHRCGSLDCHGNPQRNLILYGCEGLRLTVDQGGGGVPGCRAMGGKDTTAAEADASFRSLVGLEPAVMTAVEKGGGAHPELLTFVRKARGWEAHKGGTLFDLTKPEGSEQDQCVAGWLAGQTDPNLCKKAIADTP